MELQLVLEKAGGFFDEARADANTHRDDRARDFGGAGGGGAGGGGGGSISMSGGVGLLGGMSGSSVMSDLESGAGGGSLGASLLGGGGGSGGGGGMGSGSYLEMQPDPKAVRLGFITGVLLTDKTAPFERVLFRATRGNMFLKQSPIEGKVEDPSTGEKVGDPKPLTLNPKP